MNIINKTVITVMTTVMTVTAGSVSAQDTAGLTNGQMDAANVTNENISTLEASDATDDFRKYELSAGILFRNFISDDLGKWGAGFRYNLQDGTSSNVSTTGLAAHFTFNIIRNVGIVSGVEITRYSGNASGNFAESYETIDRGGYPFTYTYSLKEYREQQKLTLLSIPFMAKFSTNPFSDIYAKCFAAFGFKIGVPVVKQAAIEPGLVTSTGFFHDENIQYSDFPEQGFVTRFAAPEQKNAIPFKLGVVAAIETGVIFTSTENISGGASIYCDIGLNSLLRSDGRHILEYQRMTPERLHFNSIMMTDKVNSVEMFSIGLKLFVNFNLDKKINTK
jgi:hypothetical protein